MSAIQHLTINLGIDLDRAPQENKLSDVQSALHRIGSGNDATGKYLEAIYDVVVGFNRNQALDGRISPQGLTRLADTAAHLSRLPQATPGQVEVLSRIADCASNYRKLLDGIDDCIPKNMKTAGVRHSLARGKNGHVYEMTNSVTNSEFDRLMTQTEIITRNIFKAPKYRYAVDGQVYSKIELGAGAFGKTRIARDIKQDVYVAVKKTYPQLSVDNTGITLDPPLVSQFYRLRPERQAALRRLGHAVIVPVDHAFFSNSTNADLTAKLLRVRTPKTAADILERERVLEKIGINDLDTEIANRIHRRIANPSPIDIAALPKHTMYSFFELGIATVGDLVESLNQQRAYFEMFDHDPEMRRKALKLLADYSVQFKTAMNSADGADRLREADQYYRRDSFKLKDPVYNQRFLNTLGKKMLQALAELHKHDFSHQDIKPDNMVLCKGTGGALTVKLIDLDLIEEASKARQLPAAGCPMYMPPEASVTQKDGSISYTGQKVDDYAMGMSLRKVAGFACKESAVLAKAQEAKVVRDLTRDREQRAHMQEILDEVHGLAISPDNAVQDQTMIAAKAHIAPEILRLKDISDAMLKINPGKRQTSAEALDIIFFKMPGNFLSEREFAEHAQRILRLGAIADKNDLEALNDHKNGPPSNLPRLRHATEIAMRKHIDRNVIPKTGFRSRKELEQNVASHEAVLQGQAKIRRAGRFAAGIFDVFNGNKGSDAEKVLAYKRAFLKPHQT